MNDGRSWRRWATLGLTMVIALSLHDLFRAINHRYVTPAQQGPDFVSMQLWYDLHLLLALPVLLGAPLPFTVQLRQWALGVRRAIGRADAVGVRGAAPAAIDLGATGAHTKARACRSC